MDSRRGVLFGCLVCTFDALLRVELGSPFSELLNNGTAEDAAATADAARVHAIAAESGDSETVASADQAAAALETLVGKRRGFTFDPRSLAGPSLMRLSETFLVTTPQV